MLADKTIQQQLSLYCICGSEVLEVEQIKLFLPRRLKLRVIQPYFKRIKVRLVKRAEVSLLKNIQFVQLVFCLIEIFSGNECNPNMPGNVPFKTQSRRFFLKKSFHFGRIPYICNVQSTK